MPSGKHDSAMRLHTLVAPWPTAHSLDPPKWYYVRTLNVRQCYTLTARSLYFCIIVNGTYAWP